jgi:hypothetical protein
LSWIFLNFLSPPHGRRNACLISSTRTSRLILMRLVRCCGVGRKVWTQIRKTALGKRGKRLHFRRLKMNSLLGFHLLSGFAQLSFNHRPSSLRSRLKTLGLPFESVLYDLPSYSTACLVIKQ